MKRCGDGELDTPRAGFIESGCHLLESCYLETDGALQ